MRYFHLSEVLPFMVALSFYGIFRLWGKLCKNTCYKFSPLFHLHCYRQVASIFTFFFRLLYEITTFEMPSLNRYEKGTCENCGTETTKLNLAHHKKSCFAGTLYCTKCPNFSKKSQNDLTYNIAKKHSAPKPDVTFKCKL